MAIPFYIPSGSENDENSSNASGENSAASSTQSTPLSTPSRPISIPLRNNSTASSQHMQSSPNQSPMSNIDNEALVQAFYEAICRCSQGSPMSPPMSPSSPFSHGQFFFPRHMNGQSPSTSTNSTPRQSFRVISRRRLNSHGSSAQYSEVDDEEENQMPQDLFEWENHYVQREQMEEFTGQVPNPKSKGKKSSSSSSTSENNSNSNNRQKPKKGTKITNFVISALQYVIDTLK